MESYIIGLFSEQLSTYIHGFRKEQVNANLLSGKGEISEVHVKVEPINDIIKDVIPYIKLASIYVSKLSFNVTSIRNIRKSPIEISIDEVHVVLVERLAYSFSQEQWTDLTNYYLEQSKKKTGSYGLIERIRDNIALDVNRVYVTFQPMGRFKTRKIGPWTPPSFSLVMNNLRVASVDEYGEEGSPDDVWRHNSRKARQEFLNRKSGNHNNNNNFNTGTGSNSNSNSNNNGNSNSNSLQKSERTFRAKTNMVFKKVSFELSIGVGYREKGMSAKQSFLTSHLLFVNLPVQCHLAMHWQLRDNDLLAVQADLSLTNLELVIESETLPLLVNALIGLQYCFIKDRGFVDPLDDGEADESLLLLSGAIPSYKISDDNADSILKDEDGDNISSSKIDPDADDASGFDLDSDGDGDGDDVDEEEDGDLNSEMRDTVGGTSTQPSAQYEENQHAKPSDENSPVFVLPSGVIIREKLCLSLSIHSMSVRARYHSNANGYLQFTMKGLVSELIWPNTGGKQGGYVQVSFSHLNFHESYSKKIRTIINGGNRNSNETDIYEGKQTTSDESFPCMEPRDVRNDPFDLRTSFPVQAFGFKASIDLVEKEEILSIYSKVKTFVLHEIGLNAIEVTVYPEILERATQFFWKHAEDKFDYRWFSGQWQNELPSDKDVDIEECLQPLPIVITKEFALSSEYMNVTMKISDLKIKIPAPMSVDLRRSSDIIISFAEIMIVVASALPRTFLSNEIFSISSDKTSDIIPESESNFRAQITMNGLSFEVLPSILFRSSKEPQKVFYSKAITFLGSYDRMKDDVNINPHLFLSVLLHYVQLNVDFDVLSGATATILYYGEKYLGGSDEKENINVDQSILSKLPESLTLVMRLNLSKIDCRLWRQHVPVSESQVTAISVIPLLHVDAERIEIGAKILHMRLSKLFDLNEDQIESDNTLASRVGTMRLSTFENWTPSDESSKENINIATKEVEILSLGKNIGDENEARGFEFHFHSYGGSKRCYNVIVDMESTSFTFGNELENVVIMVLEAALNPEWLWMSHLVQNSLPKEHVEKLDKRSDPRLELFSSIFAVDSLSIDIIMIQVKLKSVAIIVPLQNMEQESLCVFCENADFYTGYLGDEVPQSNESSWLTMFHDFTKGFHHALSSKQRCSLLKQGSTFMEARHLVESFEFKTYFHPINIEASLTQCNLSTKELVVLNTLADTFESYRDRIVKLAVEASAVVASLNRDEHIQEEEYQNDTNGPLSLACNASTVAMETASSLLEEVNEALSSLREKIGYSFDNKNIELADMRSKFFMKEKDRFTAFALLTNEASGYIRMGSTSLSHQRIVSTTNFWRYWAVLKKGTMILFKNPSEVTPVDSFSLEGAQLLALEGGGTKRRDMKKGFAIIDSDGKKRFFIAETYAHYEKWIHAISKAMPSKGNGSNSSETNGIEKTEDATVEIKSIFRSESQESSVLKNGTGSLDGSIFKSGSLDGSIAKNNSHDTSSIANEQDQSGDITSLPDYPSIESEDGLSIDDSEGLSKLNLREKAKNRMSKFGTAMKNNVKIDKRAIQQPFQKIARKTTARNPNSTRSLHNPVMKVRGIQHSDNEPVIKEQIVHKDQQLCTISGTWVSKIKDNNNYDGMPSTTDVNIDIQLECLQWKENGIEAPSNIMVTKSVSELLKFHAEVSDALLLIRRDLNAAGLKALPDEDTNNIFAQVLHSGRIFKGLLLYKDDRSEFHLMSSVCEALEQFINALLSYPLPTFPFNLVVKFLRMQEFVPDTLESSLDSEASNLVSEEKLWDYESELVNIVSLVESCRGAIHQTKRQTVLVNKLATEVFSSVTSAKEEIKYLPSPSKYSTALHDALMAVMAERDEAQSQLVAERVFHTHQLDQEQRKIQVLEKKVHYLEKLNNEDSASAAAFFLGQEEIPNKYTLGKIEEKMVQNVDAELMELCRQLSSEISLRVSSELEILRLKESRKIERETESVERKMLDDQVAHYKQKMEEALAERDSAIKETEKWKKSFENIVAADPNSKL